MAIQRTLAQKIEKRLHKGKAIIVLGPRQCGKTTLIEDMLDGMEDHVLRLNGDEADVRVELQDATSARLRTLIGKRKIVFIDEAQRIKDIGITLKLITDQIKGVQVIVTGSSSLEIVTKTAEPLTGRKFEYRLYPFSFAEMVAEHGLLEEKRMLERRLIYGYYPEIVTNPGDAVELLKQLAASYLYKDLLSLDGIHRPALLDKILFALASQVGKEVSFNEVAQLVGADRKTVERYVDLLDKAFVLFQLPALSTNERNEVKKMRKVYFYDNGILNTILNNFNPPRLRTDIGPLWENFLISERMKYLGDNGIVARRYFWRTRQQQEIDYVEQHEGGKLQAYEFKWNPKAKPKFPRTFKEIYTDASLNFISVANYDEFLLS
jgi:predicted AAA+ superfamily ATPase